MASVAGRVVELEKGNAPKNVAKAFNLLSSPLSTWKNVRKKSLNSLTMG